jgi:DNA-directed RNA polymerase specialized sigma24 family protein
LNDVFLERPPSPFPLHHRRIIPAEGGTVSDPNENPADELLVQHCQEGDEAAWRLLYRRYHAPLLRAIARQLHMTADNDDLAEEIAARVWCALVVRGGLRLRLFDPGRGTLATYLAGLARQEIQEYYRSGPGRHLRREVPLDDARAADRAAAGPPGPLLDGFAATLTPQEVRYFHEGLLGHPPDPDARPLSPANRRKLKERVLRKLHAFLQAG